MPYHERSLTMIYSNEVNEMCCVKQGVQHGAAPIPEEARGDGACAACGTASD